MRSWYDGLPCSYYVVLPLTLLPNKAWYNLAQLTAQENLAQQLRIPPWKVAVGSVATLSGAMSPLQTLVSAQGYRL